MSFYFSNSNKLKYKLSKDSNFAIVPEDFPRWWDESESQKEREKRHGPLRQNNFFLTPYCIYASNTPPTHTRTHTHPHTHTHTHTLLHTLSKRKCSRCGGGIMLDMWSRSCSVLVIPTLRGFELSSRLDLYSVSPSVANLLHLSLYLSVSKSCGGMESWNRACNELTVGGKRETGGLHLKRARQFFSNICPLFLSLSSVLLSPTTD